MVEKLKTHYTPQKNTSAERFKFMNMRPESAEETHDRWVTRMKVKMVDCDWDKFNNEEAMKLVIMLHTHNPTLQRQMLTKNLDFKTTLEQARLHELADKELPRIKEQGSTHLSANKVTLPFRSRQRRNNPNKKPPTQCRNCGEQQSWPHTAEAPCKAKTATCYQCNKTGHYSRMCLSAPSQDRKRVNDVQLADDETAEIEKLIDSFVINVNQAGRTITKSGYPTTKIQTTLEGISMEMNVDSMADANILGQNHLELLQNKVTLLKTPAKIKPYGSPAIPTMGKFIATLETQKGTVQAEFFVAQGTQPIALMGKYTAFDLGILKIDVAKVHTSDDSVQSLPYTEIAKELTPKEATKSLLKQVYRTHTASEARVKAIVDNHPTIFQGIGKHKYRQVTLPVDPDVPPEDSASAQDSFRKERQAQAAPAGIGEPGHY